MAIDISIWLFQIQSGKGGSNPAVRTFYYRLLRLLSLNIHPLFVFDGPNKPRFKRNKRVGGAQHVSSVPEFLAKDLLEYFGFPMHHAPGEAEAECALLQREGIVDAVLSEDVDTLMFGSRITMRSWSPESKTSKVPTHVNVYDADKTETSSGLDREGMILVALMSGGDYIPEGIPGCGPKTACEAAKAGFGQELCKLRKRDDAGFQQWRDRLRHELWTNESKLFRTRRRLEIPDDFPSREVLGYYTTPCVSSSERLANLRNTLRWDLPIDFAKLRSWTAKAFDWRCIGGAKKFVRNLAPAVLTRELRLRAEQGANDGGDLAVQAAAEGRLVRAIHGRREHPSTDKMPEIRISFLPLNIVNIDLSIEPPDDEITTQQDDEDSDAVVDDDVEVESLAPSSPRKRGPSRYDPTEIEKIWLLDIFLRQGAPLKVQDWEASYEDAKTYMAAKRAAKEATKRKKATGGMSRGALDPFVRTLKPGVARSGPAKYGPQEYDVMDLSATSTGGPFLDRARTAITDRSEHATRRPDADGFSTQSFASTTLASQKQNLTRKRPSPDTLASGRPLRSKSETPRTTRHSQPTIIDLLSSPQSPKQLQPPSSQPVSRQLDFGAKQAMTPERDKILPLPDTVTRRKKRSPLKRVETAPAAFADVCLSPLTTSAVADDVEEIDMSLPALPTMDDSRHHKTLSATGDDSSDKSDSGGHGTSSRLIEHVSLLSDDAPLCEGPIPPPELAGPVFADFAKRSGEAPEKRPQKVKKRHYQVRESLEGAWKEVEVEIDLSSPARDGTSIMSKFTRNPLPRPARDTAENEKHRTKWRKSEVEFLDLTGG
ncbi:hypothetical protein ANO11243_079780 [Dothideomycetidae sp. 11243]|nr:hypothetical protein ANO11243_079780 [fungal sp. No.11243]